MSSDGLLRTAHLLDQILIWLERRKIALWNPVALAVPLALISILLACPDYRRFEPFPFAPWAAAALKWKFDHPLEIIPVQQFDAEARPHETGVVEHLLKRSYRIAVPLAANFVGVGPIGALLAQQVGGVLFLALAVATGRLLTRDYVSGLLVGLLFATSFVGQWGFNDFIYFDGIAYLCIATCIWSPWISLVALSILFGGLTDERAILAAPLIYLCLSIKSKPDRLTLSDLMLPNAAQIALLVGIAAFVTCRVALAFHMGTLGDMTGIPLSFPKDTLKLLPLALLLIAKGGVAIAALAVTATALRRRYDLFAFSLVAWLPSVSTSLFIYDFSRSLAYGFPIFFLALAVVSRTLKIDESRRVLLGAVLFNLALPTYYFMYGGLFALPPILRML